MGLIKEPKNVDFYVIDKPWSEEELTDFRKLMQRLKAKNVMHTIKKSARQKECLSKVA
jgi:hypothetical protein